MSFRIIEEYRTVGKPELGLAIKDGEHYWFRLISEESITDPKIAISSGQEEEEVEEEDLMDMSDDSRSDISFPSDDEFEDEEEKLYKYALFKLTDKQLDKCSAFFAMKNEISSQRRKNLNVIEIKYEQNLDDMFEGEFIVITQHDFENFMVPKKIELVQSIANVVYSPLFDIAKPDIE